jgi:PucR family transcriptional regulator, purine catabolism regulatory protein
MASLDELRAALLPGARVVGERSGGVDVDAPEIGWVRVMKARVPAFDALEAGDLAIVPGTALRHVAPGAAELEALVAAFGRARVGAVVLLDAEDADAADRDALDALAAALGSAALPALRTERAEAAALERSIIGFLVNRRAELEHQAAVLEGRLEALALAGTDLDGLVGAIAGFLGRAVALEGPRGAPLAVHAPPAPPSGAPSTPSAPSTAADVARYHARPRAVALRVSLPGSSGPAGSLALLGERPVSELERVVSRRIAGLVALELARGDAVRRALDTSRRSESLPAAGPPWVVLVARQRTGEGDIDTIETRERTRRELRLLAPARRMALRGDAESLELRAVLVVDTGDPQALDLAGRVAALLGRSVALSRPFSEAAGRPAAEADARATLEAVEPLEEAPAVARADRLPAYRLLGNLHNLPDGARLARALLEPLLGGRPDVQREHLATLRAVLDQPGLAEAAQMLGVHRNTVAYRVRRIEALTGWRLSDPELRLPLALALRLVQTG